MDTIFRVGDVDLSGFDAPEVIGDLGGKQLIAFHRFPGGVISAQMFGRYPEDIKFSQVLRGANALSKIDQLDDLVDAGPVVLQYGGWNFLGIVEHVQVEPYNDAEIKYTVTFKPVERDKVNAAYSPLQGQALLSQALDMAQQQALAPALSPAIAPQVSSVQQNVTQALNANSNNLYNVPISTLQTLRGQVSALSSQLAPIINGTNSSAASAAADLSNTLMHLGLALSQSVAPQVVLNVMNPNLFELSAAYYGDATKWKLILDANPELGLDPQPVGNFRLIIPEDPGLTVAQALTFQ